MTKGERDAARADSAQKVPFSLLLFVRKAQEPCLTSAHVHCMPVRHGLCGRALRRGIAAVQELELLALRAQLEHCRGVNMKLVCNLFPSLQ